MQPQEDSEALYSVKRQLHHWDLHFNAVSECIHNRDRVYILSLGPEDGFREIDHFHGIQQTYPFHPVAQLAQDELDVPCSEMLSAMPGKYLDKAINSIKGRFKVWRIQRRHFVFTLACVFTMLRPPLSQSVRHTILTFLLPKSFLARNRILAE